MKMEEFSLEDLCLKITDGSHYSPKSISSLFKMASVKDMTRFGITLETCRTISEQDYNELVRNGCRPEVGDVLIAKDGATCLDTVCVVDAQPDYVLLSSVAILRPNSKIRPNFLRYCLESPAIKKDLKDNYVSGSAIPRVVLKDFRRFKITVPPIEHQDRALKILSSLDRRIEINIQINETLESMAMAIFKEWFIDFGPVKAKAEGKKPFGMNDEVASLFPDSFEESELGQIPKGWKSGKLEEIAEVVGGGTPSTTEPSYYCEPATGISWMSPKDLSGFSWKYVSHGATDITELGLKNSSAKILPPGAVLFSSRAPIGYIAIAEKDLCTNQGFKSLVPKNGSNTEFLYYLAKASVELIESRASGSTFKEISGNGMKEIPVILPTNQILEAFRCVVSESSKLQKELRHETENLKKMRDLILPKLISGEISLNDV